MPLLFPDDLAASSRRRVVAIAREARPLDLRTRPVWSVRAMRRLMTRPAPRACVKAPTRPHPALAAVAPAQIPSPKGAQVVVVPDAARGATPTGPWVPVRVTAKTPAATATAVPPPALASATSTPPTAPPVTSGPPRLPTAPVKHGTAYDWTGLP